MENNKSNTETTDRKMYLTAAEAKEMGLPSTEEQINRWNELQKEIRRGK